MWKYSVLVPWLAVCGAYAQTTSTSMLGIVTDPSGAAVPGVEVTAANAGTNQSRRVNANDLGYYLVPALEPGEYRLTVQRAGFKTQVRSGIVLQVNQKLTVDVTLAIGEVGETTASSASGDRLPVSVFG